MTPPICQQCGSGYVVSYPMRTPEGRVIEHTCWICGHVWKERDEA